MRKHMTQHALEPHPSHSPSQERLKGVIGGFDDLFLLAFSGDCSVALP